MQSEKYFKAKQELEYLLQVQKYLDKQGKLNKQKIRRLQRKINRLSSD
jgi:hypothetical protein|tara:strand:+ start:424 stop:567 length:144 start_codon:yes stop_codon:yes gene_type:complete